METYPKTKMTKLVGFLPLWVVMHKNDEILQEIQHECCHNLAILTKKIFKN